jgi:hypothetical protein
MTERVAAFKALVGSHNYNLVTPRSDKDYKGFVYPTFDDLYKGDMFKKATTSDLQDIEYHDVRKLPTLFSKSNPSFLEVLFSEEFNTHDNLHTELTAIRDDIAKMNLPYLFDASLGMYNQAVGQFRKKAAKDDSLQASKYAASGVRIVDFLVRFFNNNFEDTKSALYYEEEDPSRDFILAIKNEEILLPHLEIVLKDQEKRALVVKEGYKRFSKDDQLQEHVENLVRKHVIKNLNI